MLRASTRGANGEPRNRPLAWVSAIVALTAALAAPSWAEQDSAQNTPADVGLTEQVEVELVLVDFLVVDKQGRNVPGLTAGDFTLKVGGRKTPIASVDVDCRVASDRAARQGSAGTQRSTPPERSPQAPRQIVLVFDYFHIENIPNTLDRALQMLDTWPTGNEIHTVISLGRSVRVEAPPTSDLGDVRWAIQRMRSDPDLYADSQTSLTQYRFFDRMKALFDLVDRTSGRKSIVLFSGPFQPDAFLHDPEYTELSGLATTTRTSIYPVDTGGLRDRLDPGLSPLGGPAELRRLANNTGGRVTADTNNIGLAYARAHSDLGCTYTLGFYNTQPRLDKKRRLTIRIKRPDTRLVYPEFYLQRSPEEEHKSRFATATIAPHMFESDQLSTELFVMGPASPTRWNALMAVEVRLQPGQSDEALELRGFLRKPNGTVMHDFKEKIPRVVDEKARTVTFFESFQVEPGRYTVSAVLSDPVDATPRAATSPAQLPRVPNGAPFLIGPILGRTTGNASTGRGKRRGGPDFEPILNGQTVQGDPLESLTLVCVSGSDSPVDILQLARNRYGTDDATSAGAAEFTTESVRLPGQGRTHCERVLDPVKTAEMPPGLYEFSATAETSSETLEGSATELQVHRDSN